MRAISNLLYTARVISPTQIETMQLVFIISDGRVDKSNELKKYIRKIQENNAFIVFIILDNPSNQHSILEVQTASFIQGKVITSNFMDSFPFPYYIILREMKMLPEVLADALRQVYFIFLYFY